MPTTYSAAATQPTDTHPTVPIHPTGWCPTPHRRLYLTAGILAGAGLLTLVIYILSAMEMHPVARTLVACLVTALISLAGAAAMLGYSVRTRAAEAQAQHAQHVAASATQAEQCHGLTGMLGQISTRLGRLEGVRERLDRVEQRQDEQDEEYERGWVDGAHRTAEALSPGSGNGHGQVRQLKPSSTPPRRPTR